MSTRTLSYIILIIAFAVWRTFSAPPPDAEASKMLVGNWLAPRLQYHAISRTAAFAFKRDGTFSSYGVFNRGNEKIRIEVRGKWRVKGGILIEELTASDHPDLAPVGLVTRDTLLAVTDKEYRFRDKGGLEYTYSRQ
jgi:hypothetical protein